MQTSAAKFAIELRKLIVEEEQKIVDYISSGHLSDYATYPRFVGMLAALRAVHEMFDIAQTNAEKF